MTVVCAVGTREEEDERDAPPKSRTRLGSLLVLLLLLLAVLLFLTEAVSRSRNAARTLSSLEEFAAEEGVFEDGLWESEGGLAIVIPGSLQGGVVLWRWTALVVATTGVRLMESEKLTLISDKNK